MTTAKEDSTGVDLGECLGEFRPSSVFMVGSALLSPLLIAAGIGEICVPVRNAVEAGWHLPITAERGRSWLLFAFFCLAGVAYIVLGLALAWYANRLRQRRVEICEAGLRLKSAGRTDELSWFHVKVIQQRLGDSGWTYTVVTLGDHKYHFKKHSTRPFRWFGQLLRERATASETPWETYGSFGVARSRLPCKLR